MTRVTLLWTFNWGGDEVPVIACFFFLSQPFTCTFSTWPALVTRPENATRVSRSFSEIGDEAWTCHSRVPTVRSSQKTEQPLFSAKRQMKSQSDSFCCSMKS